MAFFFIFVCFGICLVAGQSLNCTVVFRNDSTFGTDSLDWNGAVSNAVPFAIVFARTVDDVICGIRLAIRSQRKIAVRAGRHDYAAFSVSKDTFVIDVSNFTSIAFSTNNSSGNSYVDVGVGWRLFALYSELAARNLTFPGGSCATVGVAGFTLGGGYGFMSRLLGLGSDNLQQVDIVTVDPTPRLTTVSATSNSSLFWALRGGGNGNFGVVTRLRLTTSTLPVVVSQIRLDFPSNVTAAAWKLYEQSAPMQQPELTLQFTLYMTSSAIVGFFVGPLMQLQAIIGSMGFLALRGAVVSSSKQSSYLQTMADMAGCSSISDCLQQSMSNGSWPDLQNRAKYAAMSLYVARPMASNSSSIVPIIQLMSTAPVPFATILFDCYGGKISTIAANSTAFVHRSVLYHMQVMVYFKQQSDQSRAQRWLNSMFDLISPQTGYEGSYRNYPNVNLPNANQRYFGSNLPRLRKVKAAFDPFRLFNYTQGL